MGTKAVEKGEFPFAAAFLEHGHIYGQCQGLIEAGAQLKWVYDPDAKKVEAFLRKFPDAKPARCYEEILEDSSVRLVAAAAVPSERCALGIQAMEAGKDYFTDKGPLTTLEQLEDAKAAVRRTGRKYAVYYGERLHSECSVLAGQMVKNGAIGRVIQVLEDNKRLPEKYMPPALRSAGEVIRVSNVPMELEEKTKIWTMFSESYKLSVFYKVGPVQLESAVVTVPATRVREVQLGMEQKEREK